MKRLLRLRRKPRRPLRPADRSSGEDAIRTREESESEATPSRMNRLKTFRL